MKIALQLLLPLISLSFCYSQKMFYTANQVGFGIQNEHGDISIKKWSESILPISWDQHKGQFNIGSSLYTITQFVEKKTNMDIFEAYNDNGLRCKIVLIHFKDDMNKNQLSVYLPNHVVFLYRGITQNF